MYHRHVHRTEDIWVELKIPQLGREQIKENIQHLSKAGDS